jgi:Domain of unknown function (DUF1707)
MAQGPDLRIGDAERDLTTRHLRESFAQGRLTMDEFSDRLTKALGATTQRELDGLTRDLPPAAPRSAPLPHRAGVVPGSRQDGRRGQGSGSGPRVRSRLMTVLAGLLILWVILSTVIVPLRFFPFGGRLAILLAAFGILRGIIRRIFGMGRRR